MYAKFSMLALTSAFGLGLSACGEGGDDTVELTVVETIPVSFLDMDGGVSEGVTVALASLKDEPRYASLVERLQCGSLNLAKSSLLVEALDVGAGATVLDYRVEVAQQGSTTFRPLFIYNGSVTEDERVMLDSSRVTVAPVGLRELSAAVLSEEPALVIQIIATVPAALDDLQISLSLAIDFSNDPNGCPSLTSGL